MKYIILASGDIGGAEKRFYDVFLGLRNRGDRVKLVVPECLYQKLNTHNNDDSTGVVILNMRKWSPLRFCYLLYKDVILNSRSNDTFHYPLNPLFFLHVFPWRPYSISFCCCKQVPRLCWKSKAHCIQWFAGFFARRIDILNQDIMEEYIINHPYHSNKITLTPGGTYLSKPSSSLGSRNKDFMFISRLEKDKGLEHLLRLVPLIDELYKKKGLERCTFHVCGKGSLEPYLKHEISRARSRNIDIEYHGYVDALSFLPSVSTVLSLQDKTNYPSRVVAEALVCGCETIILDTGDSRNFGQHTGIYYLDLEYSNLNEIIETVLVTDDERRSLIMSQSLERYSSDSYLDYMLSVI